MAINIKLITIILLFSTFLGAKDLQKISLQLDWLDQFQFAGYYMAKEKGFYKDVGLDVEFKKFDNSINIVDEVTSKVATYGIGRSSLIVDKSNGKKIVLLASIFQSSPSILLALKDSNISSVKDFVGKKLMITPAVLDSVSLLAMGQHEGINPKDIIKLKHSFDVDDLVNKKTDLMASYISNEPYFLIQKGIEYKIFDPKDYGFDFYSDILFTSEQETKEHDNRDVYFRTASLRGWQYAFSHIEESVDVILKKYNTQHKSREALLYEANESKKLAYYQENALGSISKNKIQRLYDIYNTLGFVKNKIDIDKFIHIHALKLEFTQKEEEFINQNMVITYTYDPDWKPFEYTNEVGTEGGVIADFITLIKEKTHLNLQAINSKTWREALEKVKSKKVDMVDCVGKTKERDSYMNFTQHNLLSAPYVFVSRQEDNFLNGFADIKNKKIAVVKNFAIESILKEREPEIDLVIAKSIKNALGMLEDNKVDVVVLNELTAKYYVDYYAKDTLKIAYKTRYNLDMKIGFNKDMPKELISIIDKSLQMITPKEKRDIIHKWNTIKVIQKYNWKYIFEFIFVVFFVLAFIIWHNRKLNKAIIKTTKKLKESELNNYKTLFNNISNSAWIVDIYSGKILDVNKESVKNYGYTKDELLNMSVHDFDNKNNKELDAKIDLIRDAKGHIFQAKLLTKEKKELDVILNISIVVLDYKQYFLIIITDITKNIKTQKELQLHRETFDTIRCVLDEFVTNINFEDAVNNSLSKIIKTLDIDRIYIFKNYTKDGEIFCSQIFEMTKENITLQIDNPQLQDISYNAPFISRWKEVFLNKKNIQGAVKEFPDTEREFLQSQDIQSILVEPIFNEDGFWGFVGFDDCTDERVWSKLEKDILFTFTNFFISALDKDSYTKKLKQQVDSQVKKIGEQDQRLIQQSKLAQMGDMVSMIAHQWRQPLNAISATGINLSLLSSMKTLEDKKVQESSEFIQDQCQKMSQTIDTFMNFVKPEKESKPFKPTHTLEAIMQIMGTQLTNHNITVNIKSKNDNISLVGYEDLLEQVIINLLSNSRDAFEDIEKANKFINITIDVKNDTPIITIEDNAGGIPVDIQEKIFNPYFTTKEQGKGTGIGLFMSMDIMKKSFAGDLIYSATEDGSRFEIIFRVKP